MQTASSPNIEGPGESRFHDPLGANQVRRSSNDTGRISPYCFASDEWVAAWINAFNANENAKVLYFELLGRWRFEVERDRTGPGGSWEIDVTDVGAQLVDTINHRAPEVALRGEVRASHERWHKLFSGKADLRMSILTRRVYVTGDLKELRSLAKQLVAVGFHAQSVPTMFLCDSNPG